MRKELEKLRKENAWLKTKERLHELEDAQKPSPNGGLAKSCHNCGDKECKGVYETVGCWVA
jgi:hypothetical protein